MEKQGMSHCSRHISEKSWTQSSKSKTNFQFLPSLRWRCNISCERADVTFSNCCGWKYKLRKIWFRVQPATTAGVVPFYWWTVARGLPTTLCNCRFLALVLYRVPGNLSTCGHSIIYRLGWLCEQGTMVFNSSSLAHFSAELFITYSSVACSYVRWRLMLCFVCVIVLYARIIYCCNDCRSGGRWENLERLD